MAEGHAELVALLLANGADPHAVDRWGLTPIAEAERKAARVGVDPIKEMFRAGGHLPKEKESILSFFSVFYAGFELAMMVLIGLFCTYGEGAQGGQHADEAALAAGRPFQTRDEFRDPLSAEQAAFNRIYTCFQGVHLMIFVGFGFLVTQTNSHAHAHARTATTRTHAHGMNG